MAAIEVSGYFHKVCLSGWFHAPDFTSYRKVYGVEKRSLTKPVWTIKDSNVRSDPEHLAPSIGTEVFDLNSLKPNGFKWSLYLNERHVGLWPQLRCLSEFPGDTIVYYALGATFVRDHQGSCQQGRNAALLKEGLS